MTAGLLGKKTGMTRHIDSSSGLMVPVTVVTVPENEVIRVKTQEKDKKNAIVVGIDPYKKPTKNKKFKITKEFVVTDPSQYTKGQKLSVALLKEVKEVSVSSVSKGKGFQGGMKRWGFHGGPGSHGSHFHREPGSIGQRTSPGEVQKGKKLPGHMGVNRTTLKKRPVQHIDEAQHIAMIKGAIAGAKNSLIEIIF